MKEEGCSLVIGYSLFDIRYSFSSSLRLCESFLSLGNNNLERLAPGSGAGGVMEGALGDEFEAGFSGGVDFGLGSSDGLVGYPRELLAVERDFHVEGDVAVAYDDEGVEPFVSDSFCALSADFFFFADGGVLIEAKPFEQEAGFDDGHGERFANLSLTRRDFEAGEVVIRDEVVRADEEAVHEADSYTEFGEGAVFFLGGNLSGG